VVATDLAGTLAEIQRRVAQLCDQTLIVGIDGRGGAGKSTVARELAGAVRGTRIVQFDDFYLRSSQRRERRELGDAEIGGDFDWGRVRDQVLEPLRAGKPARYQRYDWVQDELAEWHVVDPGGVVIVEGNYSTRPELRPYYGLTLWVETPHELRLRRGLERDGEEARSSWLNEWMPEEDRYLAAFQPLDHVDLLIDGSDVGR
jgi:uridine kinase